MKNRFAFLNTLQVIFAGISKILEKTKYILLSLALIYLILLIYPNLLFGHSISYKNFNIYSTQPIGSNIHNLLDEVEKKLGVSEIYDQKNTHDIFLCNNYLLYSFLVPGNQKSFGCYYKIFDNIFIANCNINKNEAYKNDEKDNYTRQLSSALAHEITHPYLWKKISLWKYATAGGWKKEGYCEVIGLGESFKIDDMQKYLILHREDKRPGTNYRRYYIAVNYLMTFEKMKLDEVLSCNLTFQEVLKRVEQFKQ